MSRAATEITAELELVNLLQREIRLLGKHGRTLDHRKAAIRAEERLTAWKAEIQAELDLQPASVAVSACVGGH